MSKRRVIRALIAFCAKSQKNICVRGDWELLLFGEGMRGRGGMEEGERVRATRLL